MPGMPVVSVRKTNGGTMLAAEVQIASTSLRRAVGLLGRKQLGDEQGLWIRPCSGVHTFGMSFPIDVVGLDRELRVVRLWPQLKPYRLTTIVPAVRTVVELAAGRIAACHLHVGDRLSIQE